MDSVQNNALFTQTLCCNNWTTSHCELWSHIL